MYPLGKQFQLSYDHTKSDEKTIIKGNNYRFTVLTERLIRLEYNPKGTFVDAPTQLVINRNFGIPRYQVKQDPQFLEIITKYFDLLYVKEQPFIGTKVDPMKNLKITLNSTNRDRQKSWYYGHPEVRNLGGNMISVDIPIDKKFTKGLYSFEGFCSIDDSENKIIAMDGTFLNRDSGTVDIYVFMYDKDFPLALQDYYKLTGYPSMIPRYALGNWWSRNTTYDDDSLWKLIKKFEKKKVPLSVILFDNDWHYRTVDKYQNLETGFTFNTSLFKDPQAMIGQLHKRGIKVGLKVNPGGGFYPHEQFYQVAAQSLGLTDSKIIKFDPLNPRLVDVYLKIFLHPLEALGVDFFWNDYNGNLNLLNLWATNHYMYMDSTRNERGLILSRNSIYAPHRYPVLYAGSSGIGWNELKNVVLQQINAANVGVSWWSHDVGGNHGGIEDSDLYLRYLQFAVYSPILRFHSARGKYYKREPWSWDVKTETIAVDYLRFRHRLIPYLYTEAYQYHKFGIPLVQPLYYNFPWIYDDKLYKNEYYFGSQLIICPILEKMDPTMNRTIHRFYIPDGTWYDFKTGKKFPGNKKYISFYKDEDYPVFAHSGSIIPLSNKSDYNNTGIATDMEFHIFPGVSNSYTLYEDDGSSNLYDRGYYLKTGIDYNYLKNNYTVIIRPIEGKSGIVPEKRNYKIMFRNTKQAQEVTVYLNDQPIQALCGSDGNDFVVYIKEVPTVGQITINCKGQDIEIEAVRLINEDIDSILMDLKINTYIKEKIATIIFGEDSIQKKRIAIRKLKKEGLSKEYMDLFLKLLQYISEV